jgi:hypothetical protein
MDITQIESALDKMNEELSEIRAQYQKKTQQIFKGMFKEFFDSNPEVKCVFWRQYTPYFNDGETCEFSCYAAYAAVTNAKDYENISHGEYDGDDENVWVDDPDYGDHNAQLIPAYVATNSSALRKVLEKVSNDVYLQMFGDHCTVYATRKGFQVTEYDHD